MDFYNCAFAQNAKPRDAERAFGAQGMTKGIREVTQHPAKTRNMATTRRAKRKFRESVAV